MYVMFIDEPLHVCIYNVATCTCMYMYIVHVYMYMST